MKFRNPTAEEFLNHTSPATNALFDAIAAEYVRYKPLHTKLTSEAERHYRDFAVYEEFDDVDPFRATHAYNAHAEASTQAELIQLSINVLSAGILQIARQGISFIVPEDQRFNRGRDIRSQKLSAVIWHARNQAMHWEEGIPTNQYTKECFETLSADYGESFDLNKNSASRAKDVLEILWWDEYAKFETDMMSILS